MTTKATTPSTLIVDEVTSWPEAEAVPGDRGSSVAFKVGRKEIGHLHGDRAAHFGFPKQVWFELRNRAGSTTTPYSPASRASPRD